MSTWSYATHMPHPAAEPVRHTHVVTFEGPDPRACAVVECAMARQDVRERRVIWLRATPYRPADRSERRGERGRTASPCGGGFAMRRAFRTNGSRETSAPPGNEGWDL